MTTLLPCFNHLASSLLAGLPSTPNPRPLFTCQRHHLKSDKIKLLALQPRLKETQTLRSPKPVPALLCSLLFTGSLNHGCTAISGLSAPLLAKLHPQPVHSFQFKG